MDDIEFVELLIQAVEQEELRRRLQHGEATATSSISRIQVRIDGIRAMNDRLTGRDIDALESLISSHYDEVEALTEEQQEYIA